MGSGSQREENGLIKLFKLEVYSKYFNAIMEGKKI